MTHFNENQKEKQRQYNRTYYRKKKSVQKLRSVIQNNFQNATLLTLYFKPAVPVPYDFVSKYLLSWDNFVRRLVGGKYEFVRITEYLNVETGTMVFRYVTNLTDAQCEKIVANWCMGDTRIEHLSKDDLTSLPQTLILYPETFSTKGQPRRWWSRTRGIRC